MSGTRYNCSACPRTFSDRSHLRRHEASHSGLRPFQCPVCGNSFASDVANRHIKTCMLRSGHPVDLEAKTGRRRKACDHCAQVKKACDEEKPCLTCQVDGVLCTWERLCGEDAHAATKSAQYVDGSGPSTDSSSGSGKMRFSFLLNLMSPSNETRMDFSRALDAVASIPKRTEDVLMNDASIPRAVPEALPEIDDWLSMDPFQFPWPFPEVLPEMDAWLSADPIQFSGSFPFVSCFDDIHGFESSALDSNGNATESAISSVELLEYRANHIQEQLLAFQARSECFQPDGTTDLSVLLQKTFSAVHIHDATEAFFKCFHVHFPIIHRPSFRPESVSLHLLLAMFFVGSVHLAPKDLYYSAEKCIDLVTEFIWEAEELKLLCSGDMTRAETDPLRTLEVLQAAVLTMALETIGRSAKFRLARSRRFPLLVLAIRTLGLTSATNNYRDNSAPSGDVWNSFITNEAKIRLCFFAYILETHFVIFYQSTPHFSITEMSGSLPCCNLLFEAKNKTEFEQVKLAFMPDKEATQSLSLHSYTAMLLGESCVKVDDPRLSGLSLFDMFLIISALHSLIFTAQTSLTLEDCIGRFERALSRWKNIWGRHIEQAPPGPQRGKGVMRTAVELWWLAVLHLRRHGRDVKKIDFGTRDDMYAILKELQGSQ